MAHLVGIMLGSERPAADKFDEKADRRRHLRTNNLRLEDRNGSTSEGKVWDIPAVCEHHAERQV